MATNRMYLRFKGCGKEMMLGKMQRPGDWFFRKTNEDKGRELDDFLAAHGHCCDEVDNSLLDWDEWQNERPFELIYENDPDWGHKKSLQQLTEELEKK